jgi:hypothetical protein
MIYTRLYSFIRTHKFTVACLLPGTSVLLLAIFNRAWLFGWRLMQHHNVLAVRDSPAALYSSAGVELGMTLICMGVAIPLLVIALCCLGLRKKNETIDFFGYAMFQIFAGLMAQAIFPTAS